MNQPYPLNDIANVDFIRSYVLQLSLLRNDSRLILNKVESIYHEVYSNLPVHSYGQHGDHTALQAIIEDECGSTSFLHVEGYRLQPTHVEECFVLDSGKTWMMEEFAVHKVPSLKEIVGLPLLFELFVT